MVSAAPRTSAWIRIEMSRPRMRAAAAPHETMCFALAKVLRARLVMTNQISGVALCAAGLMLATLSSAGCGDHGCLAIVPPSSTMTLKLHLPPEHDVAMPETVKVCQAT